MLKEMYALVKSQNKVIAELKSELAEVRTKLDATYHKAFDIGNTVSFISGTVANISRRLQIVDNATRRLQIRWDV